MTTHTELDLTVIEALDFQPPCEVTLLVPSPHPCQHLAEWIVTTLRHCTPGPIRKRLLCGECLKEWMDPSRQSRCGACGKGIDVGPLITTLERIAR